MKKLFLLLPLILNVGCDGVLDSLSTKFTQFSSDDLQYLYFNKDTLNNSGQYITYKDTIYFLINSSDTIEAHVNTEIYWEEPFFNFSNTEFIYGNSKVNLPDSTGFGSLRIDISRTYDDEETKKEIVVMFSDYPYGFFNKTIYPNDTITQDTALVLNKLYKNVYKFIVPTSDNSKIRSLYFAKKFGFIKIVGTDGVTLELI